MTVNEDYAKKVIDMISGKVVKSHLGTFYFKSCGNNMKEDGYPIWVNLHRKDGPAIEWNNDVEDTHRFAGPTYMTLSGRQCYYKNGKRISKPK